MSPGVKVHVDKHLSTETFTYTIRGIEKNGLFYITPHCFAQREIVIINNEHIRNLMVLLSDSWAERAKKCADKGLDMKDIDEEMRSLFQKAKGWDDEHKDIGEWQVVGVEKQFSRCLGIL
ncbi:MAG: hypothetical protein Q9174_007528 [Haloplaca sp. 1 TL-2023]